MKTKRPGFIVTVEGDDRQSPKFVETQAEVDAIVDKAMKGNKRTSPAPMEPSTVLVVEAVRYSDAD
jgi:hypothetical protein